jgi:hypothetical protein
MFVGLLLPFAAVLSAATAIALVVALFWAASVLSSSALPQAPPSRTGGSDG